MLPAALVLPQLSLTTLRPRIITQGGPRGCCKAKEMWQLQPAPHAETERFQDRVYTGESVSSSSPSSCPAAAGLPTAISEKRRGGALLIGKMLSLWGFIVSPSVSPSKQQAKMSWQDIASRQLKHRQILLAGAFPALHTEARSCAAKRRPGSWPHPPREADTQGMLTYLTSSSCVCPRRSCSKKSPLRGM